MGTREIVKGLRHLLCMHPTMIWPLSTTEPGRIPEHSQVCPPLLKCMSKENHTIRKKYIKKKRKLYYSNGYYSKQCVCNYHNENIAILIENIAVIMFGWEGLELFRDLGNKSSCIVAATSVTISFKINKFWRRYKHLF